MLTLSKGHTLVGTEEGGCVSKEPLRVLCFAFSFLPLRTAFGAVDSKDRWRKAGAQLRRRLLLA